MVCFVSLLLRLKGMRSEDEGERKPATDCFRLMVSSVSVVLNALLQLAHAILQALCLDRSQ